MSSTRSKLTRLLNTCPDIGGIYSLTFDDAIVLTNDYAKHVHGGIPQGGWLLASAVSSNGDDGVILEDEEVVLLRVREVTPLPHERELVSGRVAVIRDAHASGQDYGDILDPHTKAEHQQSALACDVIGVFYTDVDDDEQVQFGAELDNVWASARYRVFTPSASALSWIASYPRARDSINLGNVRFSATTRNAAQHGLDECPVFVNVDDFVGRKTAVLGMTRSGKSLPLTSEIPVPASDRFPAGWATIGELRPYDEVYATDGTVTEVVGLSDVETKPAYRLHLADGRAVDCSPEHEWEIVRSNPSRDSMLDYEMSQEQAEAILAGKSPAQDGAWAPIPTISALIGLPTTLIYGPLEVGAHLGSIQNPTSSERLYPAREAVYRIAQARIEGYGRVICEAREIRDRIAAGRQVTLSAVARTDHPDHLAALGPVDVVDVTVHDPIPMRCISVAHPSGMHLTDQFVPTHNSNTIKTVVTAVHHYAATQGRSIGQIIFDPQGEYAKVNAQDGTGLRLLGDDEHVRIYTSKPAAGDPQERPLRLNFYDTDLFEVAWDMVVGAMEGAEANYVRTFRSADMERPDQNDYRALTHWGRGYMAFYGLLSRAGYKGSFVNGASISFSMKDETAHKFNTENPSYSLGGGSGTYSVSSPEQAAVLVEFVNMLIGAWEKAQKGTKEEDAEEAARLEDLIEAWTRSDQFVAVADVFKYAKGRGLAGLRELREFHDPSGRGDISELVWDDMVNGRLVIVDLSIGSDTVTKAMSERLITSLVDRASERFRSGLEPIPFQVVVEEAHNLFERGRDVKADPWVRMSKEAAKYEIGLMYATQEVTSVDQKILSNTHNWVIAHLNSEIEIRELAKYYDFGRFGASIKRAEDKGYVRLKTLSSPFIVPTQVRKFDHSMINDARAAAGLTPIPGGSPEPVAPKRKAAPAKKAAPSKSAPVNPVRKVTGVPEALGDGEF